VAVRAFRDEPSLAAGRVSGHRQILVIYAPRARSRLNPALISAGWVSAWEKFPRCPGAADLLGIQADQQVHDHLWQDGDLGGRLLQRGYLPGIRLRQAETAVHVPSKRNSLCQVPSDRTTDQYLSAIWSGLNGVPSRICPAMVLLATRMPSPARAAPSMVAAGRNAALPSETVPRPGPGGQPSRCR